MSKELTDDLITLIFNTSQILREKARASNKANNGSFLHIQTLHYIKGHEGILMRDVSGYLHITPPSATSLINWLVKKDLVKRIVDATDRRTIKLLVTPSGIELLKESFKKMSSIVEKEINKLSEKEKENFIIILKKISQ